MLHYDLLGMERYPDVEQISCIICNHLISPEYIYRYIYCLKCIKKCSNLFCVDPNKDDTMSCTDISCYNYFSKNKENYCYQCKCIEKIKLIKTTHNTISHTLPPEIIQMIFDFL
jgi:hypothetical protein